MFVFQSNVIKVKKKTFTRYIGVARIFDWRGGPNRKSHAMTLLKFFEEGLFMGPIYRKIEDQKWGLNWHVT